MKKLLVVLGLSAIAMAGKCGSSSEEKSKEASKSEEFPVKEESQVPAEEVPSYEQQEEAQPAPAETTPAPAETAAPEAGKTP